MMHDFLDRLRAASHNDDHTTSIRGTHIIEQMITATCLSEQQEEEQ